MRVIFAGTPAFAAVALQALLAAGHEVALVLTQPDRPAGRGLALSASPVKQIALAHPLPLAQPRSLKLDGKFPEDAAQSQQAIAAAQAEVMVVAAYGLILPQWVLDAMAIQRGCLNIHASLLPRWRGAAPIHRAIAAGDLETGVCIMQMDAGLDTGGVLRTERLAIAPDDTTASLHDKLAALGAQALLAVLAQPGPWPAQPQAEVSVTYAHKISKAEAALDWRHSAVALARQVRAFNPAPVAFCHCRSEPLKIYAAHEAPLENYEISSNTGKKHAGYGTILHINEAGITVQTGLGPLTLTELQRPGGKRLAAAEFLRGFPLRVGDTLV
ncbi:MAG: methionyl-tRNA formyltransferase [Burkholderiaceae bacterium]